MNFSKTVYTQDARTGQTELIGDQKHQDKNSHPLTLTCLKNNPALCPRKASYSREAKTKWFGEFWILLAISLLSYMTFHWSFNFRRQCFYSHYLPIPLFYVGMIKAVSVQHSSSLSRTRLQEQRGTLAHASHI